MRAPLAQETIWYLMNNKLGVVDSPLLQDLSALYLVAADGPRDGRVLPPPPLSPPAKIASNPDQQISRMEDGGMARK